MPRHDPAAYLRTVLHRSWDIPVADLAAQERVRAGRPSPAQRAKEDAWDRKLDDERAVNNAAANPAVRSILRGITKMIQPEAESGAKASAPREMSTALQQEAKKLASRKKDADTRDYFDALPQPQQNLIQAQARSEILTMFGDKQSRQSTIDSLIAARALTLAGAQKASQNP